MPSSGPKEQTTLYGLKLRETRSEGGFAEIVIYERDKRNEPVGVISRQITRGKWCVYLFDQWGPASKHKTRRAAVAEICKFWFDHAPLRRAA